MVATARFLSLRSIATGCSFALVAVASTACTSPAHQAPSAGQSGGSGGASGAPATRWWSNAAAQAGSSVDPAQPAAAAAELSPSADQYCVMLRQTVAAGKSVLTNVTANDPQLATLAKAFVAELEAVAPASVAGSWRVLGPAVSTFVESGGDSTKVKTVDAAAVRKAAGTVAADAKRSCGVDLS